MKKGDIKETEVFEYIKKFLKDYGYPPSYREIGKAVNIKSTNSVKGYIDRLVEKNLLVKQDNKSRCINFVKNREERKYDLVNIPIVGKVAAGIPILAEENIEDEFVISRSVFGTNEDLYMLQVTGDSMIDLGICEKDYVVVKKQEDAQNGDIVVAYINGYATVKIFYKHNGSIHLLPRNELYRPIVVEDCQILGKVVGCIKKF